MLSLVSKMVWLYKMLTFKEAWVKGIWEVLVLFLQFFFFASLQLFQNEKLKKTFNEKDIYSLRGRFRVKLPLSPLLCIWLVTLA